MPRYSDPWTNPRPVIGLGHDRRGGGGDSYGQQQASGWEGYGGVYASGQQSWRVCFLVLIKVIFHNFRTTVTRDMEAHQLELQVVIVKIRTMRRQMLLRQLARLATTMTTINHSKVIYFLFSN